MSIGDINKSLPFHLPDTANLIKSYNDAKHQEEVTFKEKSWLSSLSHYPLAQISPPNSVRTVALLAGRPFIDHTDYQNADSAEGLNYFSKFFDELLKLKKSNPQAFANYRFASQWDKITNFHNGLKDAAKWQAEMRELAQKGSNKIAQRTRLVNQYAEKLRKQFKNKKSAWFPCEIVKAGKSTTVMLKIDFTKGTVTIVNTSDEAKHYHPSITITDLDPLTKQLKETIKYQEFVKISKIDKDQLQHIDFFKFLVETQTRKVWHVNSNNINESQIYDSLTSYLGGQIEDGVNYHKHPEFYKTLDNCSGNSMKTMSTLLHYVMTENASNKEGSHPDERNAGYKQLQFLMQSHALIGFCKQTAVKHHSNPPVVLSKRDLQLLQDTVEHLSRNADKLYQSNLLDQANLDGFFATVQDIQKLLAEFKTGQDEIPATNPVACHLDQPPPAQTGNVRFSKKRVLANDNEILNPPVTQTTPLERCLENLWKKECGFGDNASSMKSGLQDLKNDMCEACQHIRDLEAQNQITEDQVKAARTVLIDKFAQVICKLPDPSREKNAFWKNIPRKHVLGCMQEVYALMRLVHDINAFHLSPNQWVQDDWNSRTKRNQHEADITVILYALHTINIQLAQSVKENRLKGFTFNHHDLISEVKSPQFVIRNPKLQKKLQSIIAYFDPKFNLEAQVTESVEPNHNHFLFDNGAKSNHKFYKQFLEDISPDSDFGKKFYDPVHGGRVSYQVSVVDGYTTIYETRQRVVKPGDTTFEHIEALVNDPNRATDRGFLPREVYVLQDSVFLCTLMHGGSSHRDQRQLTENFRLFASNGDGSTMYIGAEGCGDFDTGSHNLAVQLKANNIWYKPVGELVYDLTQRKKQNEFIHGQKKLFNLEVDATRELQMIGVDPYSAIGRLISFGKRHSYLLKNPDILSYFRLHFFRYGQLLSQMEDHADIVSSMARFFYEAIHNYKDLGDLKTCLALAKLGNDVQVFINQAGYDIPWTFVDEDEKKMVNFRKILREDLVREIDDNNKLSTQKKWEAKRQIYETLVSFYDKVETDIFLVNETAQTEATLDILGLLITQNFEGQVVKRSVDLTSVLLRLKPVINGHVLGDHSATGKRRRDQIFNSLIQIINPAYRSGKSWDGGPRIFRNADYLIDIEEGIVFHADSGKQVGNVPAAILNHEDFPKIFTGRIVTCKNSGGSTIINEGMENELRVFNTFDGNLAFERDINKEVHRYIPMPQEMIQLAPQLNVPKLRCWVCDSTNSMVILNGDKKVYKAHLAPQGNPVGNNQAYSISKLTRVNDQKRTLRWVPQNCAATLVGHLLGLPNHQQLDINKVECWVEDDTQQLAEIKCQELGLNFTVKNINGERRLFSQKHPGYYLVENPQIAVLNGLKFFTLKNLAGETKVLLPRKRIQKDLQGRVFQTLDSPLSWLDFDLKDECLHTRSNEGKLRLTALHTALGHYNEAFDLMKKINSLERFEDNPKPGVMERGAIENLSTILYKDKHPAAQAMLIQLILMVEENSLKNQMFYIPFGKNFLCSLYESYKSKASNSTIYRLTDKQEKTFIKLIEYDPGEGYRYGFFEKIVEKGTNFYVRHILLRGNRVDFLREGVTKLGSKIRTKFDLDRTKFDVERLMKLEDARRSLTTSQLRRMFENAIGWREVRRIENITSSVIVEESYFRDNFFELYHILRSGAVDQQEQILRLIKLNKNLECPYAETLERVYAKPGNYPTIAEIKNAQKKAYLATSIKDREKGRELRDRLFEKICLSKIERFFLIVKAIWKKVKSVLFSGFSVSDRISDLFYSQFKAKKHASSNEGSTHHKTLQIDGKDLKDVDQAFDTYFNKLLTDYFESTPEKVCRNGNHLPTKPARPDKNLEAKLKQENTDLKFYRASLPDTEPLYKIKVGKTLEHLQGALQKTAHTLKDQLKVQKTALLWQVNRVPEGDADKTYKNLHKIGQHDILNWDDIRQITLKGSLEALAKTHLNEEGAKQLMLGVSDYLIKASRFEQMQTILKELDKAIKATDEKKSLFIQNVAEGLKIVRTYEPDATNLHRLWFEVANHYLYREDQLKRLGDIINADLAEMPTGYGKTKTMIPSANFDKARKGNLVINTWPASLEMTNALDVKEQMETSYGRKVDRFTFNRSSRFTVESLKHIYEDLVKNRKEGIPLNVRSESLRSLELHFLLSLKLAAKNEGDKLNKEINYFIKILREIRCYGWSTIDESHVTLDPKDKLIYTVGDSTTLTAKESDVLEECFRELLKEPLASKVNIRGNQQAYVSDEVYDGEIAPVLAEHFRKKLKVSKENKESFVNFVLGKTEDIPDWIENHREKVQIGLVKGLLMLVLKSSLKGSVDENFGLSKMHINQKEYAIAFASADTPKETADNPSQFKNPHETIAKTFLTYLHKGLSKHQVNILIKKLQEQADEEAKEGGALTATAANKFFKKIAPNCPRGLKALKPEDIKEVIPVFQNNRDAIFYYIRYLVTPQLRIYSDVLVSTVHNFRTQFASSLSLSATPQAPATHGIDTTFVPMRGTSGQVTHLLLTKCKDPSKLHRLVATQPSEALDEAIELVNDNPKIKAILDIGAHTKGLSNRTVADKIRKNFFGNPDIQAIVFFDEKDGLFKIMDAATGYVQDRADNQFDPEALQAFYDQSRCFGSDLKLAVDAVGLMMTGKMTTKAEAGQAAGRLRQLNKQQSVEVVYPEKLEQEILGKEEDIKHLIMYWLANQVRQEEESNYRSQGQQMDNEIRRALMDKILGLEVGNLRPVDKEPDVNEAIKMAGKFENVFFNSDSTDPWEMYSKVFSGKDPTVCLEGAQKACMRQVKNLTGLSRKEKEIIYDRLEAYPPVWSKMALPAAVIGGPSELGMECEVLQEQEVNVVQEEAAKQKESALIQREPVKWSEKLDLFSRSWTKPQRQSLFLNKVSAGLAKASTGLAKASHWIPIKGHNRSRHLAIGGITVISLIAGAAVGAIITAAAAITSFALPIILGAGLLAAACVLVAGYGSTLINYATRFRSATPVFRMRDLAKERLPSNIVVGANFFNNSLLASNNFYKQTQLDLFEQKQQPFDAEQKPVFEVLVIQDVNESGKKNLQLMLIDQNDSVFFHRKLKADKENAKITEKQVKERKRTLAIYDIHNGMIVSQGKNGFKDEDLENNSTFQELKSQVKFLNGEINYSKVELEKIKDKAEKIGIGAVGSMFDKHILPQHPLNLRFLKNKAIAETLALRL